MSERAKTVEMQKRDNRVIYLGRWRRQEKKGNKAARRRSRDSSAGLPHLIS
jgi:hypothetical protein